MKEVCVGLFSFELSFTLLKWAVQKNKRCLILLPRTLFPWSPPTPCEADNNAVNLTIIILSTRWRTRYFVVLMFPVSELMGSWQKTDEMEHLHLTFTSYNLHRRRSSSLFSQVKSWTFELLGKITSYRFILCICCYDCSYPDGRDIKIYNCLFDYTVWTETQTNNNIVFAVFCMSTSEQSESLLKDKDSLKNWFPM